MKNFAYLFMSSHLLFSCASLSPQPTRVYHDKTGTVDSTHPEFRKDGLACAEEEGERPNVVSEELHATSEGVRGAIGDNVFSTAVTGVGLADGLGALPRIGDCLKEKGWKTVEEQE